MNHHGAIESPQLQSHQRPCNMHYRPLLCFLRKELPNIDIQHSRYWWHSRCLFGYISCIMTSSYTRWRNPYRHCCSTLLSLNYMISGWQWINSLNRADVQRSKYLKEGVSVHHKSSHLIWWNTNRSSHGQHHSAGCQWPHSEWDL